MKIHKISPDDWKILKQLVNDSLADSPDAYGEDPVSQIDSSGASDHYWQSLAKKYSSYTEVAYALIDDAEPCGLLIGRVGYIGHVWISSSRRRNGNGRRLVNEFLSWSRERKISLIRFYVNERLLPAVNFYISCGFKKTGEEEIIKNGTITMIEMELKL